MTLDQLPIGGHARIQSLDETNPDLARLAELGLIAGQKVTMLERAPLGDPLKIRFMHSELCLRRADAAGIHLESIQVSGS
jgi:ferrous iron transport protein A